MWENTLENNMREICPCCGNHSEEVVKYCKEHDNNPKALYEEAIKLGDTWQGDLIDILLSSDYNVFVPWYKSFCKYVAANAKTGSSFIANDILDYYKELFDKVEDLC